MDEQHCRFRGVAATGPVSPRIDASQCLKGIDIGAIALCLGHKSIETMHVCVEVDLASKERALTKLTPAGGNVQGFKPNDELMAFLDTL